MGIDFLRKEANTIEWLTQTSRAYQVGVGVQVLIKRDIIDSLGIKKGDLIELKIRNTGLQSTPSVRGRKKKVIQDATQGTKEPTVE